MAAAAVPGQPPDAKWMASTTSRTEQQKRTAQSQVPGKPSTTEWSPPTPQEATKAIRGCAGCAPGRDSHGIVLGYSTKLGHGLRWGVAVIRGPSVSSCVRSWACRGARVAQPLWSCQTTAGSVGLVPGSRTRLRGSLLDRDPQGCPLKDVLVQMLLNGGQGRRGPPDSMKNVRSPSSPP